MLSLESDVWSTLVHAYGPATDTPALLRLSEEELRAGHWSEATQEKIYESLLHQGSVYPATVAATPHLLKAAEASRSPAGRVSVADFAAWASRGLDERTSYGAVTEEMWQAFEGSIVRARAWAIADIQAVGGEDRMRQRLLSDIADFHGWHDLAVGIQSLLELEFQIVCKNCDEYLQLEPEDVIEEGDHAAKLSALAQRIRDGKASFDTDPPVELLAGLAEVVGEKELAGQLLDLKKTIPCPSCDEPVSLYD